MVCMILVLKEVGKMKNKRIDLLITCLLSVYCSLAITWNYEDPFVLKKFVFNFLILFIILEFIFYFFWNKVFKIKRDKVFDEFKKKEYIIYGIVIVLALLIGLFIYYPSTNNSDIDYLLGQLKENYISDWNPVPYVLLFVKIPFLISKSFFGLTIFQSIFVLFFTLYLFIYIRKNYLSFRSTLLFLVLFVANPIYIKYSVFVSKDTIYSWWMLVLTLHLINIVKSDGKWLKERKNKIGFLIGSISVLIFRHNGIIPFAFTFIYLLIAFPKIKKFIFISFISILISFNFMKGPLYKIFKIDGTLGYTEAMGVLMHNLSYYYEHALNITDEERKVLNSFTPEFVWRDNYNPRSFNSIKGVSINLNQICLNSKEDYCKYGYRENLEKNTKSIVKTWFDLTKKNPELFVRSFLNITSPVWEISLRMGEIDYLCNHDHPKLLKPDINKTFYEFFEMYYEIIVKSPLRYLFVTFGEGLFIIVFSLAIVIRKTKFSLKKLGPFVPVIVNTLTIMLIITGEEYRFVYAQGLCYLPLALYSLYDIRMRNSFTASEKRSVNVFLLSIHSVLLGAFITFLCFRFHIIKNYIIWFGIFSIIFEVLMLIIFKKDNIKEYKKELKPLIIFFKKLFINKTDKTLLQFFRYLFVGGFAAIVNISLLYILTDICNIYYLVSNVFSFTIGLVVNYLLSKLIVFQNKTIISKKKEFIIYALIGVIGLGLDSLLLSFFTKTMSIYYMLSKIVSTGCVFIWNFCARKILYKIIK